MSQSSPSSAHRGQDLRALMPETTKWVDKMRAQWGREHVNGCIRAAMAGEPGHFYAIEAGHVLGTPMPPGHPMEPTQAWAVMTGVKFAGFMRNPEDAAHGAN